MRVGGDPLLAAYGDKCILCNCDITESWERHGFLHSMALFRRHGALPGDTVVGLSGLQRGFAELRLLGLHDIADVDPLVLPGEQRQDLVRRPGHGFMRVRSPFSSRGLSADDQVDIAVEDLQQR